MCVVALAILPSALLTLFLARETKQSYRQAVLQDAGRRMELVDQAFQRTLETVQEDVDFLSTSPLYAESRGQLRRYFDASADAADSPLQAEIKAELDRFVVSRALISSAYFGASDGGFVGSLPVNVLGPNYDPRQRPWYRSALEGPLATRLSDPYLSPTQTPMISVARRIVAHSGEVTGVQSIDVTLEKLTELVESARLGKSGFMMLIDSDGLIIADPHRPENVFKRVQSVDPALHRVVSSTDTAPLTIMGEQYAREVLTYASPHFDWTYVSVLDSDELLAPAKRIRDRMWIASGLLILLFSTLGITLANRMAAAHEKRA